MPETEVAEADAAFLDLWLYGWGDLGLFLDVGLFDPAAFFGCLLVVFGVGIVSAWPDLLVVSVFAGSWPGGMVLVYLCYPV